MSKLGKKLIAAAKEAVLLVRNGNPDCALCMSGHPPVKLKRQWVHRIGHKNVLCPAEDKPPISGQSKRTLSVNPNG